MNKDIDTNKLTDTEQCGIYCAFFMKQTNDSIKELKEEVKSLKSGMLTKSDVKVFVNDVAESVLEKVNKREKEREDQAKEMFAPKEVIFRVDRMEKRNTVIDTSFALAIIAAICAVIMNK